MDGIFLSSESGAISSLIEFYHASGKGSEKWMEVITSETDIRKNSMMSFISSLS